MKLIIFVATIIPTMFVIANLYIKAYIKLNVYYAFKHNSIPT